MLEDTNKFPYAVKISWRKGDEINRWDKICAECVETYGLPGNKYTTSVHPDYMTFFFKNDCDAMWFRLTME